jgi:uncharacterized damage-inducible protein DinB
MSMKDYVSLMARYNRWMNEKLYALARSMPEEAVTRDRGAFFGSIFGTLDHICGADVLWLRRYSTALDAPETLASVVANPAAPSLDRPTTRSVAELCELRATLDDAIDAWTATLDERTLSRSIRYQNLAGQEYTRQLFPLLVHFFNHQTHHRGQATALFTQAGVEVGVTDLAVLLPEVPM